MRFFLQLKTLHSNKGLIIATFIMFVWVLHFTGLIFYFNPQQLWHYPFLLIQTFLNVGLFITAHDAMHGTVAPHSPLINKKIGQVALLLYAGFSFNKLNHHHHHHHRYPTSSMDPDYTKSLDENYFLWLKDFIFFYFGLKEAFIMLIMTSLIFYLCNGQYLKTLCVFVIPSVVSAIQLFTFGTFLPHRRGLTDFTTRHNCRSIPYPGWLSFLTCYHFGYHHEHHAYPHIPWWKLPKAYKKLSKV